MTCAGVTKIFRQELTGLEEPW